MKNRHHDKNAAIADQFVDCKSNRLSLSATFTPVIIPGQNPCIAGHFLTYQYGVTIIWVKTQLVHILAPQQLEEFVKRQFFITVEVVYIDRCNAAGQIPISKRT